MNNNQRELDMLFPIWSDGPNYLLVGNDAIDQYKQVATLVSTLDDLLHYVKAELSGRIGTVYIDAPVEAIHTLTEAHPTLTFRCIDARYPPVHGTTRQAFRDSAELMGLTELQRSAESSMKLFNAMLSTGRITTDDMIVMINVYNIVTEYVSESRLNLALRSEPKTKII